MFVGKYGSMGIMPFFRILLFMCGGWPQGLSAISWNITRKKMRKVQEWPFVLVLT